MSERATTPPPYAGARLGLPPVGPRSVASWGRRLAALTIDWFASLLVATALFGTGVWGHGWETWAPMGVFFVELTVLTALTGGSFGQLALRIAVVRVDGGPVTLLHTLLRSLLICLVVPPLIYNRDNRGLHDLVVGTVTVRR
ncbi:RDD family protein [Nocardioides mesophilus]|uniref:RDD family protein n=1 Tax=Nocardioides mesophilus TaxID=433659 RepID=A0A7G9RC93_9ACTN|nr:RDD family protein [Nocardioides mesophilus]QNN53218.1 RDD family protein [Nocardioides mesophilus]